MKTTQRFCMEFLEDRLNPASLLNLWYDTNIDVQSQTVTSTSFGLSRIDPTYGNEQVIFSDTIKQNSLSFVKPIEAVEINGIIYVDFFVQTHGPLYTSKIYKIDPEAGTSELFAVGTGGAAALAVSTDGGLLAAFYDSQSFGVSRFDLQTGAETIVYTAAIQNGIPNSIAEVGGQIFLSFNDNAYATSPPQDSSRIISINAVTGVATTFFTASHLTLDLISTTTGELMTLSAHTNYYTLDGGMTYKSAPVSVDIYHLDVNTAHETLVYTGRVMTDPNPNSFTDLNGQFFMSFNTPGRVNSFTSVPSYLSDAYEDASKIVSITPGQPTTFPLGTGTSRLLFSGNKQSLGLFPDPATVQNLGSTNSVVGATNGTLRILDAFGSTISSIKPFDGFSGDVRAVALSSGLVAAATGPGFANSLKVFTTYSDSFQKVLHPFESTFTGGLFITPANLFGTSTPDLIISPDQGGGGRIQILDGLSFAVKMDFFGIDDPNFRGGARTALGDVNGDGIPDLIVAAGQGGGPRVTIYDGSSLRSQKVVTIANFFVFEPSLRNGVYVESGDLNGDGYSDLIFGGGPGGAPRVYILSGKGIDSAAPTELGNFFAGDVNSRNGVQIAVRDLDGDKYADLLTGGGPGSGPTITAYAGVTIISNKSPLALFHFDDQDFINDGGFIV